VACDWIENALYFAQEQPVASLTKKTENKRRRRHRNAGRARKNRMAARSTVTDEELFAGCGEPGQPAPAVQQQS